LATSSITDHGDVVVVAPQGRLDRTTACAFEAELVPRADAGDRRLIVDFAEVSYISSAGLRVLLMAAKKAKAGGVTFALAGMGTRVEEVMDLSGFSSFFTIYATRADALAALG
jgi:anti-anti-sigma factor